MLIDNIRFLRQQRDYDCLIACCKMVLDYLGIHKNDRWLRRRLADGEVTPFPNIVRLTRALGLVTVTAKWGQPATFAPYIESGLPVIVAVDTDYADLWPYVPNHAVVIVGFDDDVVYVNDPQLDEPLFAVDIDTFMLAWSHRDYQYAVIQLAEQ
ncbi:MAG: C39 family peptidase [Caldilineaceae bacterium]